MAPRGRGPSHFSMTLLLHGPRGAELCRSTANAERAAEVGVATRREWRFGNQIDRKSFLIVAHVLGRERHAAKVFCLVVVRAPLGGLAVDDELPGVAGGVQQKERVVTAW